jgi:hypothetical protein
VTVCPASVAATALTQAVITPNTVSATAGLVAVIAATALPRSPVNMHRGRWGVVSHLAWPDVDPRPVVGRGAGGHIDGPHPGATM